MGEGPSRRCWSITNANDDENIEGGEDCLKGFEGPISVHVSRTVRTRRGSSGSGEASMLSDCQREEHRDPRPLAWFRCGSRSKRGLGRRPKVPIAQRASETRGRRADCEGTRMNESRREIEGRWSGIYAAGRKQRGVARGERPSRSGGRQSRRSEHRQSNNSI